MTLLKTTVSVIAALTISVGMATAQTTEEEIMEFNTKSYTAPAADFVRKLSEAAMSSTVTKEVYTKNTMLQPVSAEAKMKFFQTLLASNSMSLREMMNLLVAKKKVIPGLTFDEVVESMNSKALDLNMRPVGHNTPYVVLREVHDPNSPRLEYFSFCDMVTMRLILDYSLEFSAFVPCRIAVMEDANGDIWLTTLDWDIRWLDTSPNPNQVSDDLYERALRVRQNMEEIMEAAATGDF